MLYEMLSKNEFLAAGAVAVGRADDNSGTFVFDANDNILGFVGNGEFADGIWLYYSTDVMDWLGLSVKRPKVCGNASYFMGFIGE